MSKVRSEVALRQRELGFLASEGSLARGCVAVSPTLPHPSDYLLLVLPHQPDQRLIARIFVRGCPEHHFREHRRQIDALRRQRVDQFPAVRLIWFGGDDAIGDQFPQTICQDVFPDSFPAFPEFLLTPEPPQPPSPNV